MNLVIRADVPADADVALRLWREADAAVSTTDDADAVRTLLARDPHARWSRRRRRACERSAPVGRRPW